ncbi:INO80 complex subunit D-like [Quillaja saponaria]|uniref:INO80 complex subunit D-like n=1 Tax=Quillaja saponaria TaxID=32244 RepID=A0AAD7Q7R5_QUISA|nr:INO80 complex subunit D-like [Quillaja saponaria]
MAESNAPSSPQQHMTIDGFDQDLALAKSEFLTREEVLRRRSRRLKQLARCYKDHYWALMEQVKSKHREYYWTYGKSPFMEDQKKNNNELSDCSVVTGDNTNYDHHNGDDIVRCNFNGCKSKAMALTRYCHTHILSDSKQKLYKQCNWVHRSSPAGPTYCPKTVLRATIPPLCPAHLTGAERCLLRQLKRTGLNITTTRKLAPKFHVLVAEYVHQIQLKRRASGKPTVVKMETEEGTRSEC